MNRYISDSHFGHKNVISFNNRPFSNVDEMDRYMIDSWNLTVNKDDDVYIGGDLIYKSDREFSWYLNQLNGKLHLCIGNHDSKLLKDDKAMSRFERVDKMMHVVDGKNHIHLCHFPMAEWNGMHKGTYHMYGHVHGITDTSLMMAQREKALYIGAEITGFVPITFNEAIEVNFRYRSLVRMKYKNISD